MSFSISIKKNLEMQGFQCDTPHFSKVEPWLRFNPIICFVIVVLGLWLASSTTFFVIAAIAAFGTLFPHTVGDLIYNYGVRFFTETPLLPKNPPPRRFACFFGMVWSLAIAFSFLFAYIILGYILGIILLLVIIPMILWHYCIASLIYQKFIGYRPR